MTKWLLIASAVLLVAFTRLLPTDYRPLNFTAFGALALFVAARVGVWPSLGITAAALLASDLIQFAQHDGDAAYLPFAPTYLGLAAYSVLGRSLIGSRRNPLLIGGTVVLASGLFFLITNFVAWLHPVHGYELTPRGLLECYTLALPFYRGTLAGDLAFSALFFGAFELLTASAPACEKINVRI